MRITIKFPKRKLKLNSVNKTDKEIKKIIAKRVKETLKHFKDELDGWKIDKSMFVSDILYDIFQQPIEDEINQALYNVRLKIIYTEGNAYISNVEEYKPIYMNVKSGKLHVVEDTMDNSYVFKYSEANGYYQIGKL